MTEEFKVGDCVKIVKPRHSGLCAQYVGKIGMVMDVDSDFDEKYYSVAVVGFEDQENFESYQLEKMECSCR